ncbi:hypothetical protein [Brevibacillus reuszeri]|uniref:hypothetical protein n=1 Tax=Brevibacillus reuszeri TaxID=54915 RepID=UPI000CCC6EE5|nr:hypothetical protein [Brevibacillus reuszeri]
MESIRAGGRLKLSTKARTYYQRASKTHGGQTKLLEEALEYYVSQGALDIKRELSDIRCVLFQLAQKNGVETDPMEHPLLLCESSVKGGREN